MKKQFIILIIILLIIVAVVGLYFYNLNRLNLLAEDHNKTYEQIANQDILGTTLISVINKAIDENEKNGVQKQENSIYYQDNQEDSIQITIQFKELENTVQMEDIAAQTTENFIQFFATATFRCIKIEYHEKTNFVKSLYFEQI